MAPNRILFVDDEPGIRETLSAILQKEGFEVTCPIEIFVASRALPDSGNCGVSMP